MCGIAGIVRKEGKVAREELLKMLPGIAHRGPDGVGKYMNKNVGFLHTRLSIIDISEKGNQPLFNENKSLSLICNGEIYNYKALRGDLEKKGHQFSSNSDSEVILHLYEEYRTNPAEMLNKLDGMFAFAIHDSLDNFTLLARDRFGIKPLYYTQTKEGVFFASEISSLVGLDKKLQKEIDYTSVYEYYQYLSIPEPNTIYENVKCLPSAHLASIHLGAIVIKPWYHLHDRIANQFPGNSVDFAIEVESSVRCAVRSHMVADVAVGSFLSAGIDSTLVTQYANEYATKEFSSFTAAFPGDVEDECGIAKLTAERIGVLHFSVEVENNTIAGVEEVVKFMDQPLGISSPSSLYHISKKARPHMKVVLTGDGGDEVFGGYDHKYKPFYKPKIVEATPIFLHAWTGLILNQIPSNKLKDLAIHYRLSDVERFLNRNRVLPAFEAFNLIPFNKRRFVDRMRLSRQVEGMYTSFSSMEQLHKFLLCDIHTFLKSEMLFKVDRMTMANQMEARVPFLDHKVVELALSGMSKFLRDERGGKLVLRTLVEKQFKELAWRKKTGFNMPISRILLDQQNWNSVRYWNTETVIKNFADKDELDKMAARFQAGDASLATSMFSLMNLGAWAQRL